MGLLSPYILIADDEADDREMFIEQFLIGNPGVEVKCTKSGLDAIIHLEHCKETELPALMVIDYNMPDLSGVEVLKYIQAFEQCKDIIKIIWSTSDREEFVKKSIDNGAQKFFKKPDNIKDLRKIVDQITELFRHSLEVPHN